MRRATVERKRLLDDGTDSVMADPSPNGKNKVSDINSQSTGHYGSEKKSEAFSNKVGDISKSPSISSNDSCTKLTISKQDEEAECCGTSCAKTVFSLGICLLCGIIFGIMFCKSRVFEPKSIRDQMLFKSFIMLKMFLAAVSVGQMIFSALSVIPATKQIFDDTIAQYLTCFNGKGIFASAVGATVLGCGMTLSGACPGMVLAQFGAWVPNSIFTLLGCFIGALSYGMLAPVVQSLTKPTKGFKKQTVNQALNWPYIAVALPMAVLLAVVVFLLEFFWDYEKDIINIGRAPPPYDNVATAVAWRPSIAGGIIGLIQLPLILVAKDTMGGSSSYVTVVSQWVVTKRLQELFPYLAKARCGLENWWQVFYVCGAILGSSLASIASDTMATSYGPTVPTALFGGILMLWGARLAAGCTSGHGLSGMGLLAWLSFVAVPFMFGGGIATAFAMQATGAVNDYVSATFDT